MKIYKIKKSFQDIMWYYNKGMYAFVSDQTGFLLEKKYGKCLEYLDWVDVPRIEKNNNQYTLAEMVKQIEVRRLTCEIKLDRINKVLNKLKKEKK